MVVDEGVVCLVVLLCRRPWFETNDDVVFAVKEEFVDDPADEAVVGIKDGGWDCAFWKSV